LKYNIMKITNEKQSRRSMLKGLFGGVATAGAAIMGISSVAKASPSPASNADKSIKRLPGESKLSKGQKTLFSGTTVHNGVVYLAGMGYHEEGDITVATKDVLGQMKKKLEAAGSSMEHVLKVNVYLADLADYDTMNKAYYGSFG